MRIFVVVAKNRADLYEYFKAGFAGIAGIEVILDRRIGEELPASADPPGNRRNPRNIYDELGLRGFVIVRLPA